MSVLVKPGKWDCVHNWQYAPQANRQICLICGRVEIPPV